MIFSQPNILEINLMFCFPIIKWDKPGGGWQSLSYHCCQILMWTQTLTNLWFKVEKWIKSPSN